MPFTLSHAAAALPLARLCPRRLCLSALMVGATAPDLPYFVGLLPFAAACHYRWYGLLLAWGAAWLGWWCWCFARPRLVAILPAPYDALLSVADTPRVGWRVAVSLLLGAASHLLWDHFTHGGGVMVALLPWLAEPYAASPLYRWLQHGSTVFGLAALTLWWAVVARRRAGYCRPHWPARTLSLWLWVGALMFATLFSVRALPLAVDAERHLFYAILAACDLAVALLLAAGQFRLSVLPEK